MLKSPLSLLLHGTFLLVITATKGYAFSPSKVGVSRSKNTASSNTASLLLKFTTSCTVQSRYPLYGPFNAFSGDGDDVSPSDYDSDDLVQTEKTVTIDEREEDEIIRQELKQELMLLSSVTGRGEFSSREEQTLMVDLVSQLEGLNPTENPVDQSTGEWDLMLASTELFRSSPFFQSIRIALGDANKEISENAFSLHDLATTASRIGRVRQTVTDRQLISEVDLEVGLVPGIPLKIKGTVVTTATKKCVSPELMELQIETTTVKGSNIPIFNEMLSNMNVTLPVGQVYSAILQGTIPTVPVKTYYLDDTIRITRDVDDNFFVYSRA